MRSVETKKEKKMRAHKKTRSLPLTQFTSVVVHAHSDRLLDAAHDVVDIRRRRHSRLLTATAADDHVAPPKDRRSLHYHIERRLQMLPADV